METNSESPKSNGIDKGCLIYIAIFIGLFALAYALKEYLS